jgi:decaprenyl-phosphate phosphoribosyltransferase
MSSITKSLFAVIIDSVSEYLKLLRVRQWVKNLFLFLPLFFGLKIFDANALLLTIAGFVSFSLLASSVYIFNDYIDIEKDKLHPEKKFRPLASGKVSIRKAVVLYLFVTSIAISIAFILPSGFMLMAVIYLLNNILYSVKLKQIPLLDIFILASGFIIRIYAGAYTAGVSPSVWLVAITFLLALFIALAKRRDDVLIFNKSGDLMRKSVEGYNLQFLDIAMSIMASVTIVAYLMYSLSEEVMNRLHSEHLYFSVIFVILGIMRYMQITFVYQNSGSPTDILYKDRFIQLVLAGWIILLAFILYF